MTLSEQELIDRVRFFNNLGDKNKLIEHWKPLAYYLAKKFPPKYIEQDEAKSIAVLELIRIVHNIPNMDHVNNVPGFISVNIMRKLKRYCFFNRRHIPFRLVPGTEPEREDVEIGVEEKQNILEQFFASITSPIERKVLLKISEGYKLKDIAEYLDCSPQYISKIKEQLSHKLSGDT